MYKYSVNIKSGTGSWSDYDSCDYTLGEYETLFLPRIGETLSINLNDSAINPHTGKPYIQYYDFLIKDIVYWISGCNSGITVYVIPINGYTPK